MSIFDRIFGKTKKEQHGHIDKDTMLSYIRSFCPISRLLYLDLNLIPGETKDIDKRLHEEVPPNREDWPKDIPVIVTADPIDSFSDFAGSDFCWWVLTSENVQRWLKDDQIVLVFDFSLPRGNRALTFGFNFSVDAKWLEFLLTSYPSLWILNGPKWPVGHALAIEISPEIRNSIQKWISNRPNTK